MHSKTTSRQETHIITANTDADDATSARELLLDICKVPGKARLASVNNFAVAPRLGAAGAELVFVCDSSFEHAEAAAASVAAVQTSGQCKVVATRWADGTVSSTWLATALRELPAGARIADVRLTLKELELTFDLPAPAQLCDVFVWNMHENGIASCNGIHALPVGAKLVEREHRALAGTLSLRFAVPQDPAHSV